MKKLMICLLATTVIWSCQKSDTTPAPLVITKVDYNTNFKAGGATYNTFQASPTSVTIPTKGENQTWDFSKLAETTTTKSGGATFLTPANTSYPTATFTSAGTLARSVGSATSPTAPATFFTEISDAGIYELGYSQDVASAINVPSLGATISYAVQNLAYTGITKYPTVLFPAKFGNATTNTNGIVLTTNFTVTAAALGLNKTPGQTKVTSSVTIDIIGSGTATLKGIGNVRVLVTKNIWSDITNYFLGGAPAPAALLTNLGITDGAVTTGSTYRFIAEGLGTVGFIYVNANGTITETSFRKGN